MISQELVAGFCKDITLGHDGFDELEVYSRINGQKFSFMIMHEWSHKT